MVDGVIMPRDDGSGASPLVWFSCNPSWEMAASRYVKWGRDTGGITILNREAMALFCDGIFRIGVDHEKFVLHRWPDDLRERACISQIAYERHLAGARWANSNPMEWAGSLVPVPFESWDRIEQARGDRWETFDADAARRLTKEVGMRLTVSPTDRNV
jgi:hypothetical protein